MRYIYKASWSVVGGINLVRDSEQIELYQSPRCRFLLTNEPNILLADIDRGTALGRMMLKSLVGQARATEFPVALDAEIEEIRVERSKKIGSYPVLVVEASGEIDAHLTEQYREHDGFIVTFDAVNKQTVARTHRAEIEAMKLAVAFESEQPSRFSALGDSVYLINEEGKCIYSISFSMSSEVTVASGLTGDRVRHISTRYALLQRVNDMESVERLYSQMAEHGTDRLKAFLSGWTALEILIAKAFKVYEHAFLFPLANADQPSLRKKFLERIKSVMKDKYKLTDKFVAVAALLFPTAPDSELQEDFEKFSRLKQLRDSILHGDEFSENDLPVHELAALLRKYVLAHVATPNSALNTNTDAPTSGVPVS
ncbi:MAG: hypothetical protein NG784_06270 [Candidatus Jettenia sp.]|nr:hypothetical protein [Candidatus Jettenia sp.]